MSIGVSTKASHFYKIAKTFVTTSLSAVAGCSFNYLSLFQGSTLDAVSSPPLKGDTGITESWRQCLHPGLARKGQTKTADKLLFNFALISLQNRAGCESSGAGTTNWDQSCHNQKAMLATPTYYRNKSQLSAVLTTVTLQLLITLTQSCPAEFQKCFSQKETWYFVGVLWHRNYSREGLKGKQ